MKYLIDTNVCSAHIRRPGLLAHRFFQHASHIAIPTVVLAELYAGALQRPNSSRLLQGIADLIGESKLLDFDSTCAEHYGRIKAMLRPAGIVVPSIDLLIASVAIANDLTLVTHNTADFRAIPDLRLEDWLSP